MYISHAYTSHVIHITYISQHVQGEKREKERERQRKTEGAREKERCEFGRILRNKLQALSLRARSYT